MFSLTLGISIVLIMIHSLDRISIALAIHSLEGSLSRSLSTRLMVSICVDYLANELLYFAFGIIALYFPGDC